MPVFCVVEAVADQSGATVFWILCAEKLVLLTFSQEFGETEGR